eukprot:UN07077
MVQTPATPTTSHDTTITPTYASICGNNNNTMQKLHGNLYLLYFLAITTRISTGLKAYHANILGNKLALWDHMIEIPLALVLRRHSNANHYLLLLNVPVYPLNIH